MKRRIPAIFSFVVITLSAHHVQAQLDLVADQNPQYAVSRDKYMRMADSLNTWHSTTEQNTYHAIDYLEDKRELRRSRQASRRELRLERARYGWSYDYNSYDYNYFNPGYYNRGNYRNNYYNNRPFNYRYRSGNYLWGAIPLAFTLGLLCR